MSRLEWRCSREVKGKSLPKAKQQRRPKAEAALEPRDKIEIRRDEQKNKTKIPFSTFDDTLIAKRQSDTVVFLTNL